MKKIAALLLAVLLCLLTASGCAPAADSGDSEPTATTMPTPQQALAGKWVVESMTLDGKEQSIANIDPEKDYLFFDEYGSVISSSAKGQTAGTYTVEDGGVRVQLSSVSIFFGFADYILTAESQGENGVQRTTYKKV